MTAASLPARLGRRIRTAWHDLAQRIRPARGGRWQRGELALCIGRRWDGTDPAHPIPGDILRVRDAEIVTLDGVRTVFLTFDGKPRTHSWEARGFRHPQIYDLGRLRDTSAAAPARRTRAPLMPARQLEPTA